MSLGISGPGGAPLTDDTVYEDIGAAGIPPDSVASGYWLVKNDGRVHPFGDAHNLGNSALPSRVVTILPTVVTSVKGLLLKALAASVIGALLASAAPVGAGPAAAASDDGWIVPITATSDTSGSSPDGINSRQDIVRGVSDDGSSVVIIETAFWQTFRGIELAVEGSDTNFRLSDLIGTRIQSEIAALSGNGRYVAAVIPRLVGSQLDGFEVIRWEPRAGRYEVFQEVPAAAFFTRLVAISSNGRYIFYGHPVDTSTGELTRIDTATGTTTTIGFTGGSPGEHQVAISGDGRYVLYRVFNPSTAAWEVRRRTVANGTDVLLATLSDDEAARTARVALSPNGRYASYAGIWHDMIAGATQPFNGEPRNDGVGVRSTLSIADNGIVGFIAKSPLVPRDTNGVQDAYTWDPSTGAYDLVSISDLGTNLNANSMSITVAGNGKTAVFETGAEAHRTARPTPGGFAGAIFSRELGTTPADAGVVDAALRPAGGWWTVDRTGVVFPYGGAIRYTMDGARSRPVLFAGEEATSISSTSTGEGYWLFTSRGRVLTAGDADHHGDLLLTALAGPVIDSVVTPSGDGYYMVGADGGVFAFGDAAFRGSIPEVLGPTPLDEPVVAIAVTPSGLGYRIVAADGGVFNFGDARYFGSVPEALPGVRLNGPIVGVVSAANGYLNVASDGGIFNFGSSPFHGSLGANPPPVDVSSVVVLGDAGYVMVDRNGTAYGFGSGIELVG